MCIVYIEYDKSGPPIQHERRLSKKRSTGIEYSKKNLKLKQALAKNLKFFCMTLNISGSGTSILYTKWNDLANLKEIKHT